MAAEDLNIRGHLVRKAWLHRVIRVTGDVDTTIEYWGRAFGPGDGPAAVIADGRSFLTLPDHLQPHPGYQTFKFNIDTRRGTLEGKAIAGLSSLGLYQLTSLRISLGGREVYVEIRGRMIVGERASSLPLPAPAPPPREGELPIPANHRLAADDAG